MVRWLDGDSTGSSGEDLPWMKGFEPSPLWESEAYDVTDVYDTDKGFLVLTTHFKAFIFKREKMYEFLREALDLWVLDTTLPCCVVVEWNKSGKVRLGLDETDLLSYWVREGNRFQVKSNTGGGKEPVPKPNPLLPPVGTNDRTGARTTSTGDTANANVQTERPRRAKKAS